MTREELHKPVWSLPMRTVAQSMGISDVALAKRCRHAKAPVPLRGWWAKKAAGKPVMVLRKYALKPLKSGMFRKIPEITGMFGSGWGTWILPGEALSY